MPHLTTPSYCLLLILGFGRTLQAQSPNTVADTVKKDTARIRELNEVTVRGRKPLIDRRIDRTIINVSGMTTLTGTDTYDLLDRLPGVRVTGDGGVNLLGKGVTIYVDGRPTYLSGADLTNYLRAMPAGQLDRIELMPNPPAKYDAAGGGGIINILTRKDNKPGYNAAGTLNVGSGVYRKVNGSLNLNYRIGKLNLFATGGAGAPKDFENVSGSRQFKNTARQTTAVLDQSGRTVFDRQSSTLKLGVDYYLTKKTTLGGLLTINRTITDEVGLTINRMLTPAYQLDSVVTAVNNSSGSLRSRSINLNVAHRFDITGTELSADFDHAQVTTLSDQLFTNTTFDPLGRQTVLGTIRANLPRTIAIYAGKADYSMALTNWKLTAGLKSSWVRTNNVANYFTGAAGAEQADYTRSNTFIYRENINAAYADIGRDYRRYGFKVGVRAEQTRADGHQLGNAITADSSFTRRYTSIFPTLFLSFRPDSAGRHQFFFNYGRRINRPGYDRLNPFLSTLQRYNQEVGNPFLQPDFAHTAELSHSYGDHLNSSLYYSRLSNISSQEIVVLGDVYLRRQVNSGNMTIAGAMITYNTDVATWWNTDLSINPERVHLSLLLDGIRIDTSFVSSSLNWFNRLTLSKTLTAEVVLNWGGRSFGGQNTVQGIAAVRAGIKKQFMKGNLSVGVSGSDLFYSAITRGQIVNVRGSEASYRRSKDSRSVILSISYKLSRNAKDNKRLRDRNGVTDEQNRVITADPR